MLLSWNDSTTGYWSFPVLLIKALKRRVTKNSQSSIILIFDKESLSVKALVLSEFISEKFNRKSFRERELRSYQIKWLLIQHFKSGSWQMSNNRRAWTIFEQIHVVKHHCNPFCNYRADISGYSTLVWIETKTRKSIQWWFIPPHWFFPVTTSSPDLKQVHDFINIERITKVLWY